MNFSQITLTPVFPVWLILLLFFLGLAGAVVQFLILRKKLRGSRSLALSFLRLLAVFSRISFALNPSRTEKREHQVSTPLAVIVDTSQSMGLAGPGGKGSRLDGAKAVLLEGPKSILSTLGKDFDVRLYSLGESLRPIDAKELPGLKAERKRGDMNEALEKLGGKESIAVLFSDGNLRWQENPGSALPTLVLPMGDPGGYKDILIKSVKAPAIAFRGRETPMEVTIRSYGFTGLFLPVVLKEGNKVLAVKNARIRENPGEVTLSLSFTPEKIGPQTLQVSVPAQAGESLTSNNSASFPVKVVRDKIRILMVSGNPSMNYRFMRTALKNDPSIDLLSFVILRTPTDILNVPLQEQSLIPFPVETLFTKELSSFDLVIFDDLPSHLYIDSNYLGNIKEFVRGGGSFAMIGGPNLLDGGRYARTPLGEVLPVQVTGRGDYRRDSSYDVKLSRTGLNHPISRLMQSEAENVDLWKEMPGLDGINLLTPKNYKNVLMESADGSSRPILTVGDYGKGRVLVLATDYSWKWYMGMVGKGKGTWAYLRLMERIVRWLTKDPSLDPVRIEFPENRAIAGQESEVRVRVTAEDASRNGTVSLSVFNPDGVKMGAQLKRSGQSGEYVGSFVPEREGTYRVKAETPAGAAEESVVVAGLFGDLDASPDHEKLKRIAAATGGKMIAKGDDLLREVEAYKNRQGPIVEERSVPLWGLAYTLVLIVLLLGTEWYLRRKWGLV